MAKGFLDIRRMRYVLSVADHGSVSGAARALNVAQPALSYHLGEIERLIGGMLFERKPTGMEMTLLGHLFVGHAAEIIDRIDEAEGDILRQSACKTVRETIRLAIIPSLASTLTPALYASFSTLMPDYSLHVIDARTAFADELVRTDKADVAVQLTEATHSSEEPLAWEDLYCVTHSSHGSGDMSLAQVAGSNLILPSSGNPLRKFFEDAARKHQIIPNIHMEVDGFEPRKRVVRAGFGTTVIGARSINAEQLGPDLVARRIVEPALQRPIMLKSRRGLAPDLRARIREALVAAFG